MMILRILFYAFLIYLAFKLVFNFIIPVYRTTRQVKRGFREMQERMRQHVDPNVRQPGAAVEEKRPPQPAGDYIDFEEVD